MTSDDVEGGSLTAEEWALAASVFFSGLASGLLGMLTTIMPMLSAMDGRDFRNFMGAFLRFAEKSWGRVFNFAWSLGMGIGPIVALVLLWDDPDSTSFVLTAIALGIVIVGVYVVANAWKEPHCLGLRGDASGLGGWPAALLHDQLDPVRDDLGGVRPISGGSDLPLAPPPLLA
jgi:hypothetical protein